MKLAALMMLSLRVWAAVDNSPLDPHRDNVMMALQLPLANRYQVLTENSERAPEILTQLAFDDSQNLAVRWKSLTALAITQKRKSIPVLERALVSKEWFMRNAAMIAMARADEQATLKWVDKMMEDPALVVRTAAVEAIRTLAAREKNLMLWEKLYAKENFKKQQSLWIRRRIVETLASFARRGEEGRFIRVLEDPDVSLHPPALEALSKITGVVAPTPIRLEQIEFWRSWWEENQAQLHIQI